MVRTRGGDLRMDRVRPIASIICKESDCIYNMQRVW